MIRLTVVVAPIVLAACASQRQGIPVPRPNILVVMADDLAAWHLGCYGNREIRTPHLDRLAAEGIRMENAFVCTPVCSPSRATFFTGRTPRQHGIHDFLTSKPIPEPPQGQEAPPPSFAGEVMISDVLAGAGYDCGYIGKWHMSGEATPQHGYRFWYAWLHGGSGPYQDPIMSLNGERVQEKGYLTEIWTKRATAYIKRGAEFAAKEVQGPESRVEEVQGHGSNVQGRADIDPGPKTLDPVVQRRPWFLVVSYANPHTPYEGHPQRYYDLYKDVTFDTFGIEPKAPNALRESNLMHDPVGNLRRAAASTTALDDQIPALLRALEESGQRERTLVLFTGDNGFLYGRHGGWSKGHATNPINMYEEVIRVPMIVSWPGGLPGRRALPAFVSFYDVLPTLCEAAGARQPEGRNLPGRSFWPVLRGVGGAWENAVYFTMRNTDAVRDDRHKLVWRNGGAGPNELFDLKADPRERVNVIDAPDLAEVREALRKRLESWVERYR
jgi:arylsulfatase A-like enzyme